jgi:hypothetical protein
MRPWSGSVLPLGSRGIRRKSLRSTSRSATSGWPSRRALPTRLRVAEGPAGTLWDADLYSGPNHNGYWTDNLAGDVDALTAAGGELVFAGAGDQPGPQGFAMVDVAGSRLELVDEAMKPMFETWYTTGSFG